MQFQYSTRFQVAGDVEDWADLQDFADDRNIEIWDSEAVQAGTDRQRVTVANDAGLDGIVLYEPSNNVDTYLD